MNAFGEHRFKSYSLGERNGTWSDLKLEEDDTCMDPTPTVEEIEGSELSPSSPGFNTTSLTHRRLNSIIPIHCAWDTPDNSSEADLDDLSRDKQSSNRSSNLLSTPGNINSYQNIVRTPEKNYRNRSTADSAFLSHDQSTGCLSHRRRMSQPSALLEYCSPNHWPSVEPQKMKLLSFSSMYGISTNALSGGFSPCDLQDRLRMPHCGMPVPDSDTLALTIPDVTDRKPINRNNSPDLVSIERLVRNTLYKVTRRRSCDGTIRLGEENQSLRRGCQTPITDIRHYRRSSKFILKSKAQQRSNPSYYVRQHRCRCLFRKRRKIRKLKMHSFWSKTPLIIRTHLLSKSKRARKGKGIDACVTQTSLTSWTTIDQIYNTDNKRKKPRNKLRISMIKNCYMNVTSNNPSLKNFIPIVTDEIQQISDDIEQIDEANEESSKSDQSTQEDEIEFTPDVEDNSNQLETVDNSIFKRFMGLGKYFQPSGDQSIKETLTQTNKEDTTQSLLPSVLPWFSLPNPNGKNSPTKNHENDKEQTHQELCRQEGSWSNSTVEIISSEMNSPINKLIIHVSCDFMTQESIVLSPSNFQAYPSTNSRRHSDSISPNSKESVKAPWFSGIQALLPWRRPQNQLNHTGRQIINIPSGHRRRSVPALSLF